jgi:hypothetical protein
MTRNTWRLSRPASIFLAWAIVLVIACMATIPAQAGIVSFAGVTPLGGPPAPSVLPGAQPPVPTPIVFLETVGVIGARAGLPVDHVVTGDVAVAPVTSGGVVNPLLVDGSIPSGTPFESYLFHFDPADTVIPSLANTYPGSSIVFSNKILGVQLFSSADPLQKPALIPYIGTLEAGDAVVAANGGPPLAYYPGGLVNRGMEEDAMTITNSGFGILLAGQAFGAQIDQIRILVSVPEPASLAMAFVAIFGIMGLGRTRSTAVGS